MPTSPDNHAGLDQKEAARRLKKYGYNELPRSDQRGFLRIAADVAKEPMLILLVAAGMVYLALGDTGDALLLLGFVFVVIGITVYQENKTERSLEALRDLSSPRSLVIRGGEQVMVPGREVVTGDLVIVKEGDRIPADALLIDGYNVTVDESMLTGESVPVKKEPAATATAAFARPGGELTPFLYSGCLVIDGQGIARVAATGSDTEIGKIGRALETIDRKETPLQLEVKKIVKTFFLAAVSVVAIVVILTGVYRHDWLGGLLSGITLAMAVLPEELPVVLTIFLAVGAWRISQKKVLARKISAVEILGAAKILCVDKTGTLTQNSMRLQKLVVGDTVLSLEPEDGASENKNAKELIEYAILASKPVSFDPLELALKKIGATLLDKASPSDRVFQKEYALSKDLLALSNVWKVSGKENFVVAAKGAPEAIIDLCHLPEASKDKILGKTRELAGEGLRVIGVARAEFSGGRPPASQHDYEFEFLGLLGLADPVRAGAREAVAECREAGMRVMMITGDYPATAENIAGQVGLGSLGRIITGKEIEAMSEDELGRAVRETDIFARVIPEQKLKIVNALKASGNIVAMTGDGVNDAPALKAADIGVAMGEKGTDVAREAADLVLLDNDFSCLVAAARLGRRIFDNLKKALAYTVSVHIPIAGISLVPLLFDWPNILFPVHIVFLELIIDPTCAIVFESEAEEKNIMRRPPRDPRESVFTKNMLILSFVQGLFSLTLVGLVFALALKSGRPEAEARTLAFSVLVISNLCLILANRSWSRNFFASFLVKNRALYAVLAGTLAFLFLAIYQPTIAGVFRFSPLRPADLLLALAAGIVSLIWFELSESIVGDSPNKSRRDRVGVPA